MARRRRRRSRQSPVWFCAALLSAPIYPYSLIAGGVWSRDELASALERNTVVAAHYRDFDSDSARLTVLDAPRLAWVSYRIAERVYWTSRPVALPAGEAVLTDGRNLARARCGNRISLAPASPAGPAVDLDTPQPLPEAASDPFDLPLLAYDPFQPELPLPDYVPDTDPLNGGATLPPVIPPPVFVYFPVDRPPPVLPPAVAQVENPEPSAALLVLAGVLLLVLRGVIRSFPAA